MQPIDADQQVGVGVSGFLRSGRGDHVQDNGGEEDNREDAEAHGLGQSLRLILWLAGNQANGPAWPSKEPGAARLLGGHSRGKMANHRVDRLPGSVTSGALLRSAACPDAIAGAEHNGSKNHVERQRRDDAILPMVLPSRRDPLAGASSPGTGSREARLHGRLAATGLEGSGWWV